MVLLTAKEIAVLMAYRGMSVQAAADHALKVELAALGGEGGAIVVDREGGIAMTYTGDGMYRGWVREDGKIGEDPRTLGG
jgi:beta-aspartyl-peptidase (threonine type)